MEKSTKKYNNNVHLHGFVNGVRMNGTDSGKTAINLDVCTLESYRDKEGKPQNKRTYHDVVMYTDDKKLVKTYEKLAAACEKNRENKDVKDFKPEIHSVSLDGILVSKKDNNFQVLVGSDKIQLDVKQADREVRNRAEIVGNIASINVYPDKNFATASIANHYRPEGAKESIDTFVPIRISGDRKFSQPTFEALKKGELEVGDFIRVRGQIHNNNFEGENGTRYGMAIDVTSSELIYKKGAKQEQKAEAKKGQKTEKKPAQKAAPAQKATPKRKPAMKMG